MLKVGRNKISSFVFELIISIVLFAIPVVSNAQNWSREAKADFMIMGQQLGGDNTSGLGIQIKMKDSFAGGVGLGYNFTDNFGASVNLLITSTDLTATGYGTSSSFSSSVFFADINLDINILSQRFTPIVTAGIGSVSFQGDVGSSSFQETDFSYNIGAGIRYDVSDNFFIKALYKFGWTTMKDTDKAVQLSGIGIAIGYMYP